MSYIFGGNTGLEYEELQRKRKLAEQLRNRVAGNAPRNVGEGLNAIGQALLARSMEKKAEKGLSALAGRVSQSPEGVDPSIVRALLGRSPDAVAGGAGGTVGSAGQDLLQPSPRAIPQMQGAGNLPQDPAPMPYREGFGDTAYDAQDVWPGGPNAGMEDLEGWQIDRIKKDNMRQLAPQLDQYDPASRQRLLNDPQAQQPAPIDERELIGGDGMEMMGGQQGSDYLSGNDRGKISLRAGNDTDALKIKHALMSFMESLDDYKRIYDEGGGAVMPGPQKDRLNVQRTALQMQMKNLYELGALQGPDMALLERLMAFDPTGVGANAADMLGLADMDERFNRNNEQLRDIMLDLAAPQLREYGIAADEIANIRRPVKQMSDEEFLKSLGLE